MYALTHTHTLKSIVMHELVIEWEKLDANTFQWNWVIYLPETHFYTFSNLLAFVIKITGHDKVFSHH